MPSMRSPVGDAASTVVGRCSRNTLAWAALGGTRRGGATYPVALADAVAFQQGSERGLRVGCRERVERFHGSMRLAERGAGAFVAKPGSTGVVGRFRPVRKEE